MDFTMVLILTFFAVLIGGIFWWSSASASARQGLQSLQLDVSPEAVVEMQLEEILESRHANTESGTSFRYEFAEKANYEQLKESASEGKPLQSALLKRCIECLQCTMSFDARVKIVYESYNNMVPREVLQFLAGVKGILTQEIEDIKTEANGLKEGWGQTIFNQAMDLTVGLQRRKEARAQAEEQAALDAKNSEKKKLNDARMAEEAKAKKQRDADAAFTQLTGEKVNKRGSVKKADNSNKKKPPKKAGPTSTAPKKDFAAAPGSKHEKNKPKGGAAKDAERAKMKAKAEAKKAAM